MACNFSYSPLFLEVRCFLSLFLIHSTQLRFLGTFISRILVIEVSLTIILLLLCSILISFTYRGILLLALPFLKNTEIFLFPIAAVVLLWALNIFGYPFGLGWNASRIVAYIYFPITL